MVHFSDRLASLVLCISQFLVVHLKDSATIQKKKFTFLGFLLNLESAVKHRRLLV